jgi:ferredoxin-NADP reductase
MTAALRARRHETPTAATLVFEVGAWPGHRAGQHVDLRLTAEDGYQAERSYSIASPPERATLELTVERLEDGEVSPYLVDAMQPGDELELRGPIGDWFAWDAGAATRPLLLVGGGSGVVPLMAMLRHRAANPGAAPARLLVSARTETDLIYGDELRELAAGGDGFELHVTLTRGAPPGWAGYARRIDREMLREVGWPPRDAPDVFVCGPTAFVETAADALVVLGHDPALVRTERFGPTGFA